MNDQEKTHLTATHGFSKHRIEALTDGIFAVAMTLLVIELKIPEALHGSGETALQHQLLVLIPKYIAWIISFFVLAIFWLSSHRQLHYVRHVDGKILALKLVFLAFVSFMPFASALAGEFVYLFTSQVIYASTMFMLGIMSLLTCRYIYRHPDLCSTAMSEATYRAARFRTNCLLVVALMSIVVANFFSGLGNTAFMLMIPASILARRMEVKFATNAASRANEDKIQSI